MVFHAVSSISGNLPHIEFASGTYCSTSTCGGTGSQVFVSSRSEFGRFCSQLANARVALSDNSCRVLLAMAALLYLGHISAAPFTFSVVMLTMLERLAPRCHTSVSVVW
jgi:hypothetical protein